MNLTCTKCQTTSDGDSLNWIDVHAAGWETESFAGRYVGEHVFCSWPCLADWALARSAEVLAR